MQPERPIKEKVVKVRLTREEWSRLVAMAELCNLSVSELIRRQMAGIKIESNEQAQQFLVLAKINADLGRLGGLLKLWLSDPGKEQQGRKLEIPTLINQIKSTQGLLAQTARELATRQ